MQYVSELCLTKAFLKHVPNHKAGRQDLLSAVSAGSSGVKPKISSTQDGGVTNRTYWETYSVNAAECLFDVHLLSPMCPK